MTKLRTYEKKEPETLYSGVELVEKLCALDGPTGSEKPVADFIASQLYNSDADVLSDRAGSVYACLKGGGPGYDEKKPKKVMLGKQPSDCKL